VNSAFSKNFSRGNKSGKILFFSLQNGKILFFPLQNKKTAFLAKNVKIQGEALIPFPFPTLIGPV